MLPGMTFSTPPTFTTIPNAASKLGLTSGWLKAQLEAGRLPGLRDGPRGTWRVSVAQVRSALEARAAANAGPAADVGRSPAGTTARPHPLPHGWRVTT